MGGGTYLGMLVDILQFGIWYSKRIEFGRSFMLPQIHMGLSGYRNYSMAMVDYRRNCLSIGGIVPIHLVSYTVQPFFVLHDNLCAIYFCFASIGSRIFIPFKQVEIWKRGNSIKVYIGHEVCKVIRGMSIR